MQEDFQEGGVTVQFCISNPVNIEGVGGPGLFGQLWFCFLQSPSKNITPAINQDMTLFT